ncbi:MAG: GNAT family N-acetyltransferase [Chloroflexota bacterium]|nr:GNAT family N-acetyltransferase [Chloroflexota bacterium]
MADLTVRRADSQADHDACYAIRAAVFADEQGVQGAERGDRDDATAIHALGLVDNVPAGTGRLHIVRARSGPEGQIAWVSVLPRFRRMGVATLVMQHLMDAARDLALPVVTLSAQTYAKGLYESFGFAPMSTPFHMANIEHMMMIAYLDASAGPQSP